MIFGKARLVFAGWEQENMNNAVKCIRKIRNGHLAATFTEYGDAVSYAREKGCDAVFFDCASDEGAYWQKALHEIDKDIIVSFSDKFYIDAFGWCKHTGEYEDRFQRISSACWYDPYDLPEAFGYREIWASVNKMADAKALHLDLPGEIQQHSQRVADRTVKAMQFALNSKLLEDTEYQYYLYPGFMDYLYEAALLHDVGKAFLPPWLLKKREPLTRAERTLYHMHAQFGDELFKPLEIPLIIDETLTGEPLRRYMAQSCAAYHHEFVGSEPLQNGHDPADTPIWAQVCGIANLWDNLINEGLDGREYTEREAGQWLEDHKEWFTPEALEAFLGYRRTLANANEDNPT